MAGDGDADDTVLTNLAKMADAGLVRVYATSEGERRFAPLEVIREYAAERLAASGELADIHRRHAAWCLELASSAEPHLRSGGRQPWLERLSTEHDNLRTALAWCLATPGELETGLQLVGALVYYWYFRSYHAEGRRWLLEYLSRPVTAAWPRLRAMALWGAGSWPGRMATLPRRGGCSRNPSISSSMPAMSVASRGPCRAWAWSWSCSASQRPRRRRASAGSRVVGCRRTPGCGRTSAITRPSLYGWP